VIDRNSRRITTTISKERFDFIKSRGWRFSELILLGIQQKEQNPALIERISKLEKANFVMQDRLVRQAEIIQKNIKR
jgi:hypothetical protein